MVLLTIAPWVIMVHQHDGDFWNYFFWQEHIERFFGDESSQHPEGWWFLIPWLFIGPLPWLLLLPQIIKGYGGRWKEYFKQPLFRYCACWLALPFILCSASSGKLITYILPCFPPIAVLLAFGLDKYFVQGHFTDINKVLRFFSWTFFVIVSLLAVLQLLFGAGILKFALYGDNEDYKWIIAASTLLAWALFVRHAAAASDGYVKFGYFALGTAIVMAGFNLVVPKIIERRRAPLAQLRKFADTVNGDTVLVSYKNLISSVCWAFKRDDVYLYHKAGELTYGLGREDAKHRLLSNEDFLKLIKNTPRDVTIIMDSDKHRKTLPDYESGIWENRVFVKKYPGKKKP
ncbi:MAG: hypothetical protein PHV59_10260 [Victivallales bacterium]|nr:hypothetical protein [Victivallales bacterium]